MEKHYTIKEIQEQLAISEDTVHRLIKVDRKITAVKIGRTWRIPASSINAYLKSRTLTAKTA